MLHVLDALGRPHKRATVHHDRRREIVVIEPEGHGFLSDFDAVSDSGRAAPVIGAEGISIVHRGMHGHQVSWVTTIRIVLGRAGGVNTVVSVYCDHEGVSRPVVDAAAGDFYVVVKGRVRGNSICLQL